MQTKNEEDAWKHITTVPVIKDPRSKLTGYSMEDPSHISNGNPRSKLRGIANFKDHQWIESKEEIESPHLQNVPIPVAVAYKLELRIVSKKLSWAASTIVEVALESP